MAHIGTGYFDSRGQFFQTPEEATISDLATMLGRIGDGESLAPGIALLLLEKRHALENIFAEHDRMVAQGAQASAAFDADGAGATVSPLRSIR